MNFWKTNLIPTLVLLRPNTLIEKSLYDWQINHLASALLIDDYNPQVVVTKTAFSGESNFVFNVDCLISGSFIMNTVMRMYGYSHIQYDDIDIYFKSKESARQFVLDNHGELWNGYVGFNFDNPMCAYGNISGNKINVIYGVQFDSPESLISKFDIRACSMAINPNTKELFIVEGALNDCITLSTVFNPVPRGVSMRRLIKYIQKGFNIEPYQNVFFVELLKTHIYSSELELITKDY